MSTNLLERREQVKQWLTVCDQQYELRQQAIAAVQDNYNLQAARDLGRWAKIELSGYCSEGSDLLSVRQQLIGALRELDLLIGDNDDATELREALNASHH